VDEEALRDILPRWSEQGASPEDHAPIVYDDRLPHDVVATLGSLALVASESLQHQTSPRSSAQALVAAGRRYNGGGGHTGGGHPSPECRHPEIAFDARTDWRLTVKRPASALLTEPTKI
jgi:hypothetical protein